MEKSYITFTVVAVLLLAIITGCQNDGNIGTLFGTWRIDSMSVDGVDSDEQYLKNTTLSFQNNIVAITTVFDEYQNYFTVYGTWTETEDALTLNFTHHDDYDEPGTGHYAPPEWLGMTTDYPMVMTVVDKKRKAMTLTWTNPSGTVYVYELHKTW